MDSSGKRSSRPLLSKVSSSFSLFSLLALIFTLGSTAYRSGSRAKSSGLKNFCLFSSSRNWLASNAGSSTNLSRWGSTSFATCSTSAESWPTTSPGCPFWPQPQREVLLFELYELNPVACWTAASSSAAITASTDSTLAAARPIPTGPTASCWFHVFTRGVRLRTICHCTRFKGVPKQMWSTLTSFSPIASQFRTRTRRLLPSLSCILVLLLDELQGKEGA